MDKPVILLTNFIPPYRIPVLRALRGKLGKLKILISADMEPNREWPTEWADLEVTVQKSIRIQRKWKHPYGFTEPLFLYIPWDTLWLLMKNQPKAVISAEMGLRTLQCALYRSLFSSCRLVIWATLSEHTEQGRGWLRLILRRYLINRADAIIVNGESGARYIRRFGVGDEKIVRVPQTTDVKAFASIEKTASENDAIQLIYVGRLIELKGLEPFLTVLAVWGQSHPERQVKFHLVGEGPLRIPIEAYPMPSNIELILHGFVPYRDLPDFYARADIFVLPTLADEWALVVNEAMAAGLPVLGSLHSQAVEELIEDGIHGWTFYPHQPNALLPILEKALSSPRKNLQAMGYAAHKRIMTLTPDLIADLISQTVNQNESERVGIQT